MQSLLVDVLRSPELMAELSPVQWDLLVRQARSSGLIAQLAFILEDRASTVCPAAPRRHLEGGRRIAEKLARDVQLEVRRIAEPLAAENSLVALV